jgi:outer membrane protein assembly factor BamB
MKSPLFSTLSLACGVLFLTLSVNAHAFENWPTWRGPLATGHTDETELPVKWSAENIQWKVDVGGRGQSSPIIWGDKIFLTSAHDKGNKRSVSCIDMSGKVLWQKIAWEGEPELVHNMNPWASASCVTDGERVVAFFGKGGIHCYDFDGKLLWTKDLGKFDGPWGTAASPIIVGDLVIQNCDADDQSYIIALNKKNGETVWKTDREIVRGWSTPILVETKERTELVMNGHHGVNSYDPKTGKELWFCKGDTGRGTPTVVPYGETLIAVNGRPGAMFAVKPGGSGQVNDSHEVWRTRRGIGRDLPSPLIIGDYLLVVSLKPGIAVSYNAKTGEELDKVRLSGEFSASPIAADGLAYIPNEDGEVFVIRPGKKIEIVARNKVNSGDDEIFRASITPLGGKLYLRSDKTLYCIK